MGIRGFAGRPERGAARRRGSGRAVGGPGTACKTRRGERMMRSAMVPDADSSSESAASEPCCWGPGLSGSGPYDVPFALLAHPRGVRRHLRDLHPGLWAARIPGLPPMLPLAVDAGTLVVISGDCQAQPFLSESMSAPVRLSRTVRPSAGVHHARITVERRPGDPPGRGVAARLAAHRDVARFALSRRGAGHAVRRAGCRATACPARTVARDGDPV